MLPLLLVACTGGTTVEDRKAGPREEESGTPTDSGESGDSGGEMGETGEPGPVEYDCAALSDTPLGIEELDGPSGYHDVAFDSAGNLLGFDGNSLMRATSDGDSAPWIPRLAAVQGMDWLPDGSLVFGDDANQRLVKVSPDGAQTTLAGSVGMVYGVTVGPDGMVYVGNGRNISRVDPDSGAVTEILKLQRGEQPRVAQFSLDSTRMFISTVGAGRVYVVEVDTTLTPVGEATLYARIQGATWHDGLGIDACGNLYVPDYSTRSLYRINTDGSVVTLINQAMSRYGHGLEWGRGYGGWAQDTLYLPQPYDRNTVRAVRIGVPSGSTVRTGP